MLAAASAWVWLGSGEPSQPPAPPVWRSGFESGTLAGWTRQDAARSRIRVVATHARQGKRAVRFELRPGDRVFDSLELSQLVRATGERAGQEWWWAFSVLLPSGMPPQNGWCLFAEWHQTGLDDVTQGPAPINFDCTGGEFTLIVRGGDEPDWKERRFPLPDLADGRWHDLLFHVRWSPDPDGLAALWIDGNEVVPETRLATSYRDQGLYLKAGPYRSPDGNPGTLVVYEDAWRQGASRASVE